MQKTGTDRLKQLADNVRGKGITVSLAITHAKLLVFLARSGPLRLSVTIIYKDVDQAVADYLARNRHNGAA